MGRVYQVTATANKTTITGRGSGIDRRFAIEDTTDLRAGVFIVLVFEAQRIGFYARWRAHEAFGCFTGSIATSCRIRVELNCGASHGREPWANYPSAVFARRVIRPGGLGGNTLSGRGPENLTARQGPQRPPFQPPPTPRTGTSVEGCVSRAQGLDAAAHPHIARRADS